LMGTLPATYWRVIMWDSRPIVCVSNSVVIVDFCENAIYLVIF